MSASSTADKGSAKAWRGRGAGHWLALAASPTFALMAWLAASGAPAMPMCSSGSSLLPVDGMTTMYLLMSLFHLSPWLKLISRRP
jgi:hypothetical protein